MKLMMILVMLTIGALASLSFLGKQMGVEVIKAPTMPTLPSISLPDGAGGDLTATKVHKWQDANGQWHYGDAPPDNRTMTETVTVRTDQNVLPHYQPAPRAESAAMEPSAPVANTDAEELGIPSTLPSQAMMQMQKEAAEQAMRQLKGE